MSKFCIDCKKKLRKQNIILLVSFLVLALISFSFINFPLLYHNVESKLDTLYYSSVLKQFEKISEDNQNDEIVLSVYNICKNLEGDEKIKCVYEVVDVFFNFSDHDCFNCLKPLDKLISDGGVCRDWTIFYDSIFDLMEYETEMIIVPGHIYLKIYGNETYKITQGEQNHLIKINTFI